LRKREAKSSGSTLLKREHLAKSSGSTLLKREDLTATKDADDMSLMFKAK